MKGKRRETHYFDWRFNKLLPEPTTINYMNHDIDNHHDQNNDSHVDEGLSSSISSAANKEHYHYYMNFYESEVLNKHPSLITGNIHNDDCDDNDNKLVFVDDDYYGLGDVDDDKHIIVLSKSILNLYSIYLI